MLCTRLLVHFLKVLYFLNQKSKFDLVNTFPSKQYAIYPNIKKKLKKKFWWTFEVARTLYYIIFVSQKNAR